MTAAHCCHDISGEVWTLLEPYLPGRKGAWGGRAKDNRRFINAVFWILRTGAPWGELPPDDGDWKNTHRRGSAAGVMRVPGRRCWRGWPMIRILSG